jgi:predicted NAD/FAD-binding protein
VLEPGNAKKFDGVTLAQYLADEKYSKFFADNYVVGAGLGL